MKRYIAIVLTLVILFGVVSGTAQAVEKNYSLKSSGIDYQTVKARLVSLGSSITEISIVLNGEYYSKENNMGLTDCTLRVVLSGNVVSLYNGEILIASGSEVNICRYSQHKDAGYIQIGERKYLGDFRFRCDKNSDGVQYLQVINHVPMAYYLYGVLYGEMGNETHTEALKSQAIAAKCYCIMKMQAGSNYDIGDTSATQVYKGYDSSWTNIMAAVDSTITKTVTYNGKILRTYYASSNGGETDLPTNAWGGEANLNNGFAMVLDDYDFNSTGMRETLSVKTGANAQNDEKLVGMLIAYAKSYEEIPILGLQSIDVCEVNTPKTSGSVRNMTNIHFEFTVKLDETAEANTEQSSARSITMDIDVSELMRFGVFTNDRLRTYWGRRIDSSTYEIYHVRFGHGVGLSQRGAKYRASQGQSYQEILSFYYPGTVLTDADITLPTGTAYTPKPKTAEPAVVAVKDSELKEVSMSKHDVEIAKKPEMNTTAKTQQILQGTQASEQMSVECYAYVTVDGAELKSSATSSGVTVNRLSYGDMLIVLKSENGWFRVETHDNMTGYIRTENVKTLDKAGEASYTYKLGYISSDSVNFRSNPDTSSTSYGRLSKNTPVYIWGTAGSSGDWYFVQNGLTYGYVFGEYVSIRGTYSAVSVAGGSIVASGITKSEVNLRPEPSTQNTPLATLNSGTYILIYSYGNSWYSVNVNGTKGYIRNDYVTVNTAIPMSPQTVANPVEPKEIGIGTINDSNVRFRSTPSTSESNNILAVLQKGTEITLYALENNWYYAKYNEMMGYVYAQYVDVQEHENTPTVPDEVPILARGKSTASVNFRTEASLTSEVILTIAKNEKFDVIGTYEDWYFVRYNGKCGFVVMKYATITDDGNIDLISVSKDWESYDTVTSDMVNFRKGPSMQYSIIQKLPEGAEVKVLAIVGGWCLVDYNSFIGFVSHEYLEK